ncbi:hypothetical protein [Loktanella sp. Alg231-35]|uniref:hypothetical protein n=1 Tax=Loktanella sp. Alg231-35 TaxID=1922220 RepID=UPI00131F2D5D|nr:hypothetical protein [Loktanella sp. Alg231-35]
MNVDRLIQMMMRKLMRSGINKGIDLAARQGKAPEDMTPQEREQAKSAKQTAQKAQKGMRAARRFLR